MFFFTILAWVALCASATPTWPSSTDVLEDIMFLNAGYRKSGFADAVTPCSFSAAGPGRITAAEWIRTAFHDMASGDVYSETGGLDASIMFETNRAENTGAAFNTSLAFFANYYSTQASVSDLIALSVYTAVRSCGGPVVPIRAGRIDATVAGPEGLIPTPQDSADTFEDQFARTGFNTADMIGMTACGHTVGGVHAADFPQIVPVGSAPPYGYKAIDSTIAVFDNRVAVEWIDGNTADPMSVGPSVKAGFNSDAKVFGADGNVTMQVLTNPTEFASTCASILQRMIEVVPQQVVFTDFIAPYDVKPTALQLTLLSGGTSISFTGLIRVRTTVLPASNIASVQLTYKDRNGGNACGACTISTSAAGTTTGFDDSFVFYSFSYTLPSDTSISSFNVIINLVGGGNELYNNNGVGFPVQDSIMFQSPQSCLNQGKLTIVAAVRNTRTSLPVTLDLSLMVPRQGVIVPALQSVSLAMVQGASVGPYSLYSVSYAVTSSQALTTKFNVTSGSPNSAGTVADAFKSTSDLSSCDSGGESSGSSSSSTSSSSSSSTTKATASSTTTSVKSSSTSTATKLTTASSTSSKTSTSTTSKTQAADLKSSSTKSSSTTSTAKSSSSSSPSLFSSSIVTITLTTTTTTWLATCTTPSV